MMCEYLIDRIQNTHYYNLLMIIRMSQYSYIDTTKNQLILANTAILVSYSKTKAYLKEGMQSSDTSAKIPLLKL